VNAGEQGKRKKEKVNAGEQGKRKKEKGMNAAE
jgi:hypothetical protein